MGGDFLDYFQLTDGSIGLYLGDVSGKGLPAAMYAALAVGALRGVHKTGEAPGKVLSTLNRRLLVRGMPRRYSATQYAVFHPRTREMHIASAGLPGPFHVSQPCLKHPGPKHQGCRALDIPGMPVGLFEVAQYETATVKFEPGDAMIFCTDGITEAFNIHGESFGTERVARICEVERQASPPKFLSQIFAAVERFTQGREQHDDMAAVVFRAYTSVAGFEKHGEWMGPHIPRLVPLLASSPGNCRVWWQIVWMGSVRADGSNHRRAQVVSQRPTPGHAACSTASARLAAAASLVSYEMPVEIC